MGLPTKDYFLYFAYGSNLFKKRILINNPTSIFVGTGQLHLCLGVTAVRTPSQDVQPSLSLSRLIRHRRRDIKKNIIICLLNHMLDFANYNSNWQGAVATIVPIENEIVWGAIWKLHNDDLAALDRQEGVAAKEYFAKIVDIHFSEKYIKCRTYQHFFKPPFRSPYNKLPKNRQPSITYINCIIMGAIECNLPKNYTDMLKSIPNNGCYASPGIRKKLNV